ncbi:TetR/AcrR family transcriptional regulator [Aestuariivirga sp.]|uniref:TetR/AcrR family transcriptional regulator n=1 Tax=Aestuariivirga sp. TaxID=2650926 RepID=UPI0039E37E63
MDSKVSPPPSRKASREHRRQQMIEATIETLARKGFSQTTMTDVAAIAGVSHGLVNFHFQTKEKLLTDTLLYLSDEYTANWREALEKAPESPAERINALILADFNDRICTPDRLSAWCAYWGESQSRPLYQQNCAANDDAYAEMLEGLCRKLAEEGGYAVNAARAARIIRVVTEGTWLDMMSMVDPYSRDEALKTVYAATASLFPRHFDDNGLI